MTMRFSQRMGKTEIQTTIQKDTMSGSFKNRLINKIESIENNPDFSGWTDNMQDFECEYCDYFAIRYGRAWGYLNHFGFFGYVEDIEDVYQIYDIVEFLVGYLIGNFIVEQTNIIRQFNDIFELEKSAYRFGGNGELIAITDEIELAAINRASNLSKPYPVVYGHLEKAKIFFSDRKQPDYDKTIVESIHAIEAVCRDITGDDKATLGDALKNIKLHQALKDSLTKLYGFSGDTVRHAKKPNNIKIDENDARLILIASHSIVNYLISKYL